MARDGVGESLKVPWYGLRYGGHFVLSQETYSRSRLLASRDGGAETLALVTRPPRDHVVASFKRDVC